ncbi:Tetratricopeptide-like helical domain-containing protein [Rozella allomycis CSF55]|uniref:Tetratricopeptide-like helical domain-containing protein n=1 Tax=Rozella allomycis (strain CSF55) TaxID=988480 RepID=A0A075B3U7_ROZAC|nr:Tetratricopeptide-like helical domain-containing protein [Rozella allomycis CSF55]|eukprot:EPZ35792.1 Tetratricopeptide-like helical domain-containing protein [Rozella allomycis CSF55]
MSNRSFNGFANNDIQSPNSSIPRSVVDSNNQAKKTFDDPFGNLISFGSSKVQSPSNMSLDEQMKMIEKQKQTQMLNSFSSLSVKSTSLNPVAGPTFQNQNTPKTSPLDTWNLDYLENTSPKANSSVSKKQSERELIFDIFETPTTIKVKDDEKKPTPSFQQTGNSESMALPIKPTRQPEPIFSSPRLDSNKESKSSIEIQKLVEMGFSKEMATTAYNASNRDLSAAVSLLLATQQTEKAQQIKRNDSNQSISSETVSKVVSNVANFGMNLFQKAKSKISNVVEQQLNKGSNNWHDEEDEEDYYKQDTKETSNNSNQQMKPIIPQVFKAPVVQKQKIEAPDSVTQAAEILKEQGNVYFKQGNYTDAEDKYTKGIEMLPAGHELYICLLNNRASCRLKNGSYKSAEEDASKVLSFEPNDLKALLRRANAYEALEKFDKAQADYKSILTLDPSISSASQALSRINKGLKQLNDGNTIEKSINSEIKSSHVDPSVKAAQEAIVNKLKEQQKAAEVEEQEKLSFKDQVDDKINAWKHQKETNIRALLSSLEVILWKELEWKPVNLSDLIQPNKVKIQYMKAIAKLHPDKLGNNLSVEQKMIANGIFSVLNQAWDAFKAQNNM